MCGIIGLFLKNRKLKPELGVLATPMLEILSERGPDSAGFAVYGDGRRGHLKFTIRGTLATNFDAIADMCSAELGVEISVARRDTHAVFTVPATHATQFRAFLAESVPDVTLVGAGTRMELYKEVGLPGEVARRFGLEKMSGSHIIGHTRMATESAVTTEGAHPFSTGTDQCLVHNGSLSNHNAVRRGLAHDGLSFATDNDSEVAAGYLTWQMQRGQDLGAALGAALHDLDGFYTFVVGTENGFGVLRDPIACKPAIMAETDNYVAFGTEYRALAHLPGVENATVFEPTPAKVYFWNLPA